MTSIFGNVYIDSCNKTFHRAIIKMKLIDETSNTYIDFDAKNNNVHQKTLLQKVTIQTLYKHFIGYMDDDNKTRPFSIIFPKTSADVKSCDGTTK